MWILKLIFLRSIIFSVVFQLIALISFSQKEKQLINTLRNYLESENAPTHIDSILFYFDKISFLSNKIKDAEGICYSSIGTAHVLKDFDLKRVDFELHEIDSLQNEGYILSPENRIEYYLVIGYVAGLKNELLKEIQFYQKADSVYESNKHIGFQTKLNIQTYIANYYTGIQQLNKSIFILKENLNIWEKSGEDKNNHAYINTFNNIGINYYALQQYDSSIYYIKKALTLGLENFNDPHYEYLTICRSYLCLDEKDSTLKYLAKSKQYFPFNYGYSIDIVQYYNVLGDIYMKFEQYDSSFHYYSKSLKVSDSLNFVDGLKSLNAKLLLQELKKWNREDLIDYFNSYRIFSDSIFDRNSRETEQKFLVEYETLKKEKIIDDLNQINERKQLINILLGVSILVLLLTSLFILFRYKQKRKLLLQKLNYQAEQKKGLILELDKKIEELRQNKQLAENLKKKLEKEEHIEQIMELLNRSYITDQEWDNIILQYSNFDSEFIKYLKFGEIALTKQDVKLSILLKLGYSNPSISEIFNISIDGVKKSKYRLKQKIGNKFQDLDLQ